MLIFVNNMICLIYCFYVRLSDSQYSLFFPHLFIYLYKIGGAVTPTGV
jgi:hypothetical protein